MHTKLNMLVYTTLSRELNVLVSLLTLPFFFMVVVRKMQCPLLCKDFVIDIWQIYYARSKGADAILLIAAVLPDLDIKYMLRVCRSLGMAALVEVSTHKLRSYSGVSLQACLYLFTLLIYIFFTGPL
jgi:indole-3-glycerol phosphate synthase